MTKPWDVRPAASNGDFDPDILFSQIGRALTEWSHLETTCAEIYAILVAAKGRYPFQAPALRAYGSLSSLSGQTQLIQYAAEAFFHTKLKKRPLSGQLDALLKLIKDFSARRNEIAHGQVSQVYLRTNQRSQSLKNVGYFLLPSLYSPKKYKLVEKEITYQYCSSDVIHYRQEFTKLHLRMAVFRDQLKG